MKSTTQSLLSGMVVTLAVTTVSLTAMAQSGGRLSLADRVQRLEQQAQGQGGSQETVELLNRLNQLQSELQTLRGLVEQQAFEIDQLKRRQREQYIDLDTRLSRAAGGGAAAISDGTAAPDYGDGVEMLPEMSPGDASSVAGDPLIEPPELRSDVEPELSVQPLPVQAPAGSQQIADPLLEKQLYDQAFDALKEGRFADAARRFNSFLEQYPNGQFAGNAQYWLGESYYVTQNYRMALDTFAVLLERYPDSSKVGDAWLKIGYCHYELREWDEAERALNRVVESYPDTTLARLAQGRLRALRLDRR